MASLRSVLSEPGGPPSLRLFRVFGIQLTLNWSWLLLLGLLVWVARSLLTERGLNWSGPALWALSLVAALIAVVSLFGHELAHALVARHYGIPVRSISLFMLGGMAHITRESPSPRAEFLIALSGPVVSLVIGALGGVASWLLGGVSPPLAALGFWLFMVNVPLAIFNLVPAYPLDGGRILRAVLWFAGEDLQWGTTVAVRVGQVAAVGLLFSGVWVLFDGTGSALAGLWLIMIAWFMYAGATSSQYATVVHEALRRLTVASVMDRDFGQLQAEQSVQAFAEEHLQAKQTQPKSFAVYRDQALVGLLSMRQLGRIPVQTWPQARIENATQPIDALPSMEPSAPALGALHLLVEEGVEYVTVMAEGRLLGLITRDNLARAATSK